MLTQQQITSFQKIVLDFYRQHGRHHLPWRTTHTTPYHIMVSEIMLQQTQVERVIPKFLAFMERFPTIHDLASAPQSDVLKLWSGLGYNRRARFLHLATKAIVERHQGVIPQTLPELTALPGLGSYTSSAILAFAYNRPVSVIETNIRTVYIHHFYPHEEQVDDKLLLRLINATISQDNPREWYAALMDYGAHLKSTVGNLTRKSKAYTKQSKFEGSTRQIRGAILRFLQNKTYTVQEIVKLTKNEYPNTLQDTEIILTQLTKEGLVFRLRNKIYLR